MVYGVYMNKSDPKDRYRQQRAGAKTRGIEWKFTFETWWAVWAPHWEGRGTRLHNKLCMARFGDVGPYSPTNVHIITQLQNKRDGAQYLVERVLRKIRAERKLETYFTCASEQPK